MIQPGLTGLRRIFVTGTPIPNRPAELFPFLQQIDPEGMGKSHDKFVFRYCDAKYDTWGHLNTKGASNLDELQERLRATCLVRRLKKDVLDDLPDKFHQIVEIEATGSLWRLAKQEVEADKRNKETIANIKRTLEGIKDLTSQEYKD
jgi:SNF2 family DNA or RNA helicase